MIRDLLTVPSLPLQADARPIETGETASGSHSVDTIAIGHTLPRGSKVDSVTLDGTKTGWQQRSTNRGLEITTKAKPGRHTVVVTAR